MSTTGGLARQSTIFYKRLALLVAEKRELKYSDVIRWLRLKLSFCLLRSSIMCLRGSRSSYHRPVKADVSIDTQSAEARV